MNRRERRLQKMGIRPKSKFWTLKGKTVWDLFQLLIIPVALAAIAIFFNHSERVRNEAVEATRIAEQRSVEATGIVEDRAEMSESSWIPSGIVEAIGIPEAIEMNEAIVTAGAC